MRLRPPSNLVKGGFEVYIRLSEIRAHFIMRFCPGLKKKKTNFPTFSIFFGSQAKLLNVKRFFSSAHSVLTVYKCGKKSFEITQSIWSANVS